MTMKMTTGVLLAVTLLPVSAGCRDSGGLPRRPAWPDTTNDLAVVRNDRPGEGTPVWGLPVDSPSLVLGDEEGGDFFVGTARPARLSDGRIVVSDREELRVYSPGGALVASFREGDGPQELPRHGFRTVIARGDTIIAGSFAVGPIKVIDPSVMRVVRVVSRERPDIHSFLSRVGKLDDGRWMTVRQLTDKRYPGGGEAEPRRMEHEWVLHEPDFSSQRVLLRYPGARCGPFSPGAASARTRACFGNSPLLRHTPSSRS